jgi:hypothetical protein
MTRNQLIRGVVVVALVGLSACSRKTAPEMSAPPQVAAAAEPGGGTSAPAGAAAKDGVANGQALPATSRKVIRNAELTMVVASPSEAETTISQMVERLGGYIASSDHQAVDDSEARANLSLRVPVAHLEEALREIKKLSVGLANEKIGSDDVTDEYIDLTAHITNQQALEKQLATILAQASSVDGALKVHHELAAVRTEIDRLQGRQRFLESESALAKIAVALTPKAKPPQIIAVAPVTFGDNVREAVSESVGVAKALTSGIVIFGIQAAGILLPLALLFGLPALAVAWLARKRYKRLTATLSA